MWLRWLRGQASVIWYFPNPAIEDPQVLSQPTSPAISSSFGSIGAANKISNEEKAGGRRTVFAVKNSETL